jgi:hypothetical protein
MSSPQIVWDDQADQAGKPPANIQWDDEQKPKGGAVSRFLSRATDGLSDEIAADPNRALNPFSRKYWQAARENHGVPTPKLPFEDTRADLKAHNYAGVAGDLLPGAIQLGLAVGGARGGGRWVDAPPAADINDSYFPARRPDAMSEAVPAETDALSAAAKDHTDLQHYPDPRFGMEMRVPPPATKAPTPPTFPDPRAVPEPGVSPFMGRYRMGPGEVPADVVGEPPSNVLAGNQGVIVRQPKLLKEAPAYKPRTADTVDDLAVRESIEDEFNREGRNVARDASREWYDRNSPSVPKWKQVAQIRAQLAAEAVMKEAEAAQQIPARMTKTRPPRSEQAKSRSDVPPVTGEEDLLPKLEESLRQARAKKGQPRAGK